ncbi:hypothetical protein ABMY20_12800 [Tenacibaculum sp. SSH1-16]|uniref:hypothetical protein n=1 Tax=Tenacibaculum sp. SSH1-16 TaxID=3136667 RepID=UPI0032C47E34|nr:hypothetical protein BACY1_08510 [Tenacibaculum mesophilum]
MEKISIQISYNILDILCDLYNDVMEYDKKNPSEIQFNKGFKANKNIIDLLFVRLKKEVISKAGTNKLIKLSFKYYQAYFLINFISENITFVKGIYEQNLMLSFTSQIHEEL